MTTCAFRCLRELCRLPRARARAKSAGFAPHAQVRGPSPETLRARPLDPMAPLSGRAREVDLDRRALVRHVLSSALALFAARPIRARAEVSAPAEAREPLEGARLDEVLAEIARARKGVRTLRARFIQERKLSLLATTVKSTGQFAFVAPDRLRWELAPPDDVVYWVGPEGLSMRSGTGRATTAPPSTNAVRALADLRALLAGDLGQLRDRYVLAASRSKADVQIVGTAKDRSATVRSFSLTLDPGLVLPLRARLVEGKADATDLTFSGAAVNVPVDPASVRP